MMSDELIQELILPIITLIIGWILRHKGQPEPILKAINGGNKDGKH